MITKEERLDTIIQLLYKDGKVSISSLASLFNVTDMTIRRDFDSLVSLGKIVRTHGGAVLANPESPSALNQIAEASYNARLVENAVSKNYIARIAVQLIKPGQHVYLDSGTTTQSIAQSIPAGISCTFITNAVNVSTALLANAHKNVIMIGGEIDLNTWSSRGRLAESQINDFHSNISFIACNAVSPEGNAMVGHASEPSLKQTVMSISDKVYLVADSSKFDNYSLISYASVSEYDGIITDRDLPDSIRKRIVDCGGKFVMDDNE